MSLATALENLKTLAAGLDGMEAAYNQPPPELDTFPCALIYVDMGEMYSQSAGIHEGLHTLILEVHTGRTVTPETILAAAPWPERVFTAIHNNRTLSGAIKGNINYPIVYKASAIAYGAEIHWGVRFQIVGRIKFDI